MGGGAEIAENFNLEMARFYSSILTYVFKVLLCNVKQNIRTGRAKKVTPRKNSISLELQQVFFSKLTVLIEEDSVHICQISLQYLLAFQKYNYLN